jgi:hypothetical protein
MVEHGSDSHASAPPSGLERAATWVSLACAVHCLLVPLLAAGLPLAAGTGARFISHPAVELGLAAVVLGGAGFTGLLGFRRHRDVRVLAVLAAGLVLYVLGHVLDGWPSSALSIAGALLLAAASFTSARLSHMHDESCAHQH